LPLHRSRALGRAFLMIVAVVNVDASDLEAGEAVDRFIKGQCLLAGRNAGAMLADIDIEEDFDLLFGRSHHLGKRLQRGVVIRHD